MIMFMCTIGMGWGTRRGGTYPVERVVVARRTSGVARSRRRRSSWPQTYRYQCTQPYVPREGTSQTPKHEEREMNEAFFANFH